MSTLSLYHSATGKQAPHCVNLVGIGKSGAQFIDSVLRTGEIEDMLQDPRARFTALAVDIGDGDMKQLQHYSAAFLERLSDRGIPTERVQIRTVSLDIPTAEELEASMGRLPGLLAKEFPRFAWQEEQLPFTSWLTGEESLPTGRKNYVSQVELPTPDEHVSRSLAKAIYNRAYYDGDRPLLRELDAFANSIASTRLPSLVFLAFGIGGGTGSGIATDLARHLSTGALARRVPVVGVGFLPSSGDPERHRGASVYSTLNELDCLLDETKNGKIASIWGDLYRNPFTGGFLAVPQEKSWERLHRYTTITKTVSAEIRHQQALHVTNKFVDDCLAHQILDDSGREIFRALRPSGWTGGPHEGLGKAAHNWTLFDVAKLMHPGVEVLPGEPLSKWRQAIGQWIDYIPKFSGLREGFRTEHIEAYTYSARTKWNDTLQNKLEAVLRGYLLPGEDGSLRTVQGEFFDELTLYTNIIIGGVAKTDLTAFHAAKPLYEALSERERTRISASLLELGVVISDESKENPGFVGRTLPGATAWNTGITTGNLQGEGIADTAIAYLTEVMAPAVATVVPTP